MEPMSVAEIAKLTGKTNHLVRSVVNRLGLIPTHTEPIGRFPRQFFQPEKIIEELKNTKTWRLGPSQRRL